MSENEKKPAEAVEPQAPKKKVDGPLTTLRKLATKKPAEESAPAAPPVEPAAPEVAPTAVTEAPAVETAATTEAVVVDVVVETPKPRRCTCGRKWSAPAPDQCPECGGDTREE